LPARHPGRRQGLRAPDAWRCGRRNL